jgi:hypothetical protein
MNEILLHYESVNPISWAYLSSLLMIGLFFKFGRFWSVRNLDLILLILFAPGLLLFHFGRQAEVRALETMAQEEALANIFHPVHLRAQTKLKIQTSQQSSIQIQTPIPIQATPTQLMVAR